jgi:hypothetical protein|tara:strand:- start:10 stop:279 length:270 start_codon:yes stop_codon:yes gene_type:complete
MTNINGFKGTFVKQNGEERQMTFVKLPDLPEGFLNSKVKGTGKQVKMTEGRELVWEVDHGFRVFNWNSVVGRIESISVKKDIFVLDKTV